MKYPLILLALAASVASGMRASAHHRFAETYLEDREITLEGDVAMWQYREPHAFLHVIVSNRTSRPEVWIVECRGAAQLRRHGVTPETLKPGQRVIITGSPGRISADRRLRLRAIVRPQDGWRWRDAVD